MKKVYLSLILILSIVLLSGCGYKFDGKKINLDKEYKDNYITYKYPSTFKEKDNKEQYGDKVKVYEYYKDDKLSFILKVEEYSLGLSMSKMEEDAKKIEDDKENKNLEQNTIKVNGKAMVKYSFKRKDEFGDNTLYYVYYGGYSYMGVREYIKISLINIEGRKKKKKAFLSSFKINK